MLRALMLLRVVPLAGLLAATTAPQDLSPISGKVVDGKGVSIPGATVRLFAGETGPPVELLTEIDGTFTFANLPAASYRLVAEMAGFQAATVEGVNPQSESSRNLVVTLRRPERAPAASPQTTEARPPRNAGERTRPAEGGARGQENGGAGGRFQEVELAGVNGAADGAAAAAESPATVRGDNSDLLVISGNPSATIDSGDWNDPRFRERMIEMARGMGFGIGEGGGFGRFGGRGEGGGFGGGPGGPGGFGGFGGRGGRGGAQPRLNGNITASYRNSAFNARPYSITGTEVSKPLQIQNNFGASVGGPLPWGSKAPPATTRRGGRGGFAGPQQPGMWFVSYEGSRNRNPYDVLTTVPTELERAGDFSQTSLRAGQLAGRGVTLYDPAAPTPTLFDGSRIPASRMNPAAVALLRYIPLPDLAGSVQNFTLQRGLKSTSDSVSARVNTRLSPKHNVFASYSFRSGDSLSSQIFPGL